MGAKKRCPEYYDGKAKKATSAFAFYLAKLAPKRKQKYKGLDRIQISSILNDEFKLLTPKQRLPYDRMAAKDLKRYWRQVKKLEKVKFKIATRSSINNVKSVNEKLNEKQRDAIRSVGFGSMLDIDLGNLRHAICLWVAEAFDAATNTFDFHGTKYHFGPNDVESMIGIPNQGQRIKFSETRDAAYLRVKARFGSSDVISFKTLNAKLKNNNRADDDFIRSYLMIIFAYFLFPDTYCGIKAYYLQPLVDIDSIAKYNWAQLVFDLLRSGIVEFNGRRKQMDNEEGNSTSKRFTFRGCMYLLMVLFLDQINGPNEFNRQHHETPSITYWNTTNIRNKFKRVGGCFRFPKRCNVIPKVEEYKIHEKMETEVVEERIKKIENNVAKVVEYVVAQEDSKDVNGNKLLDRLNKLVERVDEIQASLNIQSENEPSVQKGGDKGESSRPSIDVNQTIHDVSDDDEGGVTNAVLQPHSFVDTLILKTEDRPLISYLLLGPPDEPVVDYMVGHVTRGQMRNLIVPGNMVDEEIISAMAHALNFEETAKGRKKYFCPTSVWQMAQSKEENREFRTQYWINNQFNGNFESLKEIYVPYNKDLHWGMVIIDLDFKKVYRCDTLKSYIRAGIFNEELAKTLAFLHEQFSLHPSYKLDITTFDTKIPKWVTGQSPFGNDCAIYVCEMMRIKNKIEEWGDEFSATKRFSVAQYIWRHDINSNNGQKYVACYSQ